MTKIDGMDKLIKETRRDCQMKDAECMTVVKNLEIAEKQLEESSGKVNDMQKNISFHQKRADQLENKLQEAGAKLKIATQKEEDLMLRLQKIEQQKPKQTPAATPKTTDEPTRTGRSSSVDRKRPASGVLEKGSTVRRCQLCRTNRNLSMMKDCPHFICSTCKKYSRDCYDCLQLKKGEVQASTVNPALSTVTSHPSPRPARQQRLTKRVQRPRSATPNPTSSTRECPICLSGVTTAKTLHKCQHTFCKNCIDTAMDHKPVCPVCGYIYGPMIGNQPVGTMVVNVDKDRQLPGYGGCGTITMTYNFADGTQSNEHPDPGRPYDGTTMTAYLPYNTQGYEILKLFRRAFKAKLLFTIGLSVDTGRDDKVVWNDIHQKTSRDGGPANNGYPDPSYLERVKEELAAKGIK